ncbi:GIY-YIG nuclease family protein [Rhizobium sp. RAF36]|uniref:GIY-YIG nuclease family protein n=1 Tax=Rhizobium sp. RAF36 TaxID=3233055 RepID=UPI000DD8CC8A
MATGIFGLLGQLNSSPEPHFHHWQGASGQWWITTVFPLLASHIDQSSVYVMVRREANGMARPLYIGQTSDTARRMDEHLNDKIWQAMNLGGNELHLHFLAKTEQERFAIETDIRNGHETPLNRQNSVATAGSFLGLLSSKPIAMGLGR